MHPQTAPELFGSAKTTISFASVGVNGGRDRIPGL